MYNPYVSIMGYSQNSPFKNNPYLNIRGNSITMHNTNIPLLLQPMKKGKKIGKAKLGIPFDKNPYLFPSADSVMEIPIAQKGGFNWQQPISRPSSESTSIQLYNPYIQSIQNTATTGQTKEQMDASSKAMGKGKQTEERLKQQRIAERKTAVLAKDKKQPFLLPTGENKTYDQMDFREKRYVDGKALEQRFRINENDEAWYDDYINPLNWIGSMAGTLGTASYEAKQSDSNLPYLSAIGIPLIAGATGFDPLGSTMKVPGKVTQSMKSGLLSNAYKLNPLALKEAQETMLVRARPVGQNPYINMTTAYEKGLSNGTRKKDWIMEEISNISKGYSPDRANILGREKYYGQWFADNPSNLDFYINPGTTNFEDNVQIEILKTRVPKTEASKYSVKNFEDAKPLSRLHDEEYILPKDMVQSLDRFSIKDLNKLQEEYKQINTPHWLKGYNKKVPKSVPMYEEYFRNLQTNNTKLQKLVASKKITHDDYIKQSELYAQELHKSLGLGEKLGSGTYGTVFELADNPSKVIKLGQPYGNKWTPELIEELKSIKQNANIAIPEDVQYFKIPSEWENKGYGPNTKEVVTMPNLNKTSAERLNLNKRDRYAYFLKQARQLRDKGIKLDVENPENFKFNEAKNVFDIYDVNPGHINNPAAYMRYIKDKTQRRLLDNMLYKQGGPVDPPNYKLLFKPIGRNTSESTSIGINPINIKQIDEERFRKQFITNRPKETINVAKKSTPYSEAVRIQKNQQFAATNPYTQIDQQGNLSRQQWDRSMIGEADKYTPAAKIDRGLDAAVTGLEAAGYLEGAGAIGKAFGKEVMSALAESTQSGLLSNAYKLNPWAFKPDPKAYYRGIGRTGLDDAINSRVLRTANETGNYGDNLYMAKDFRTARGNYSRNQSYGRGDPFSDDFVMIQPKDSKSYIAEIPHKNVPNVVDQGFAVYNKNSIPVSDVKLYGQHWLKGYKEIKVPQKQFKSEIDWARWNKEIPENTNKDVWWNGKGYQSTPPSSQEVISISSGMDAVLAKQPGYNSHLFKKQGYVPPTTDPRLMATQGNINSNSVTQGNIGSVTYSANPSTQTGINIPNSLRNIEPTDYNFINMGENPIKGQGYAVDPEDYVGGLSNPEWRTDTGNTVGKWLNQNRVKDGDAITTYLSNPSTQTSTFGNIRNKLFGSKSDIGSKSEIDWSKWNSDIPNNKTLMSEYNTIEKKFKADGTWMKNPDGSAFQGTPEQFVQQNSKNFKKAFPNGYLSAYRGSQSFEPTLTKSLRGNSEDQILFGATNKETAESYASNFGYNLDHLFKDIGKKPEFFHPNKNVTSIYTGYIEDVNPGMYEYAVRKDLSTVIGDGAGDNWRNVESNTVLEWLKNKGRYYRDGLDFSQKVNKVSTDDMANYMIKNKVPIGIAKRTKDSYGTYADPGDILMTNSKVAKPKSLRYNNGMFDMTNPNIYKALLPPVVGAGILQQKQKGGLIKAQDGGSIDDSDEIWNLLFSEDDESKEEDNKPIGSIWNQVSTVAQSEKDDTESIRQRERYIQNYNSQQFGNGDNKAQYAYNFFKSRGLASHQAAGIVNNLIQESGNFRDDVIDFSVTGDNTLKDKGYGIAQWRGPRKENFLNFANQNGLNPYSLDSQLMFVEKEAKERGDWDKLLQTRDIADATHNFNYNYEVSADSRNPALKYMRLKHTNKYNIWE